VAGYGRGWRRSSRSGYPGPRRSVGARERLACHERRGQEAPRPRVPQHCTVRGHVPGWRTIKGNSSKSKTVGGGIANGAASAATLTNTPLDSNKPFNCSGALTSGGGNVENAATCGFGAGDIPNAGKLQVKGLKFNAQVAQTHALKATSPAIDAGVDAGRPELDENFRGRVDVPNVGTGICDSGAFEFQLP
jgi:hypothetical protein